MDKFVLIDNAIEDADVMRLEYAMRVLTAAKAAGYEPILVVNKRCQSVTMPGIKVVAAYQHYEHKADSRNEIISRFMSPIQDIYKKLSLRLVTKIFLARPGLLGYKIVTKVDERLSFINTYRLKLKAFCQKFSRVFVVAPFQRYKNKLFFKEANQYFLQGTQAVFKDLALTANDVIFMPSMQPLELHALTQFLQVESSAPKVSWHLLFKQNIYQGREPDYFYQNEGLRGLRCGFSAAEETLAKQNLFLYTDTIELTKQYARLGILKFMTLPVCIEPAYQKSSGQYGNSSHSLCVSYLGEARVEKGYGRLPSIIQDLWADYVSTGKIHFILQSYSKTLPIAPVIRVAEAQLASFSSDHVNLLPRPLSSSDYRNILLASDIVILPYDAEVYYARSASVFVEALAAGIPVLVPAASWMAAELAHVVTEYHHLLCTDLKLLTSKRLHDFSWHTDEALLTPPVSARNMLMKEQLPYYASTEIPATATHAAVFFESVRNAGGEYLTVSVTHLDKMQSPLKKSHATLGGMSGETQSFLVELAAGVNSLRLELKNTFSNYCLEVSRFDVNFIMSTVALPQSVVGIIYSDTADIAASLIEIAENYPHYQATAQAFSDTWREHHSAQNLVNILIENTNGYVGGKTNHAIRISEPSEMTS